MSSYAIRDLKRNTELLILAEYLLDPSVKRREIADRLGVTEQAVSQYISELEQEGLIATIKGHAKPTRKGVQLLQERFVLLNEEIKAILRRIQVMDTCIALAGANVRAKGKVGLAMERGRLMAYPNRGSTSSGIARSDARKGDDVLIGNLEGVVDMNLGELLILQTPTESSGGSRGVDLSIATKAQKSFEKNEVAIADLVADVVAMKLKLKPTIIHAPVQGTMNALSKGLNVLFIGTRESARDLIESVDRLRDQTSYSISYRLVDIGK